MPKGAGRSRLRPLTFWVLHSALWQPLLGCCACALFVLCGLMFLQHHWRGVGWPFGRPKATHKQPDVVLASHFLVLLAYEQLWGEITCPIYYMFCFSTCFPRCSFAPCFCFTVCCPEQKFPALLSLLLCISSSFLHSVAFALLSAVQPACASCCPLSSLFSCSCSPPLFILRTSTLHGRYIPRHQPYLN